MVINVAGLRLLGVLGPLPRFAPTDLLLATLLMDVPAAVLALVLARRLLGVGPGGIGLARPAPRAIGFGVFAGAAAFLAALPLELVQRAAFGSPQQALVQAFQGHRGLDAFLIDAAAAVVVAPLVEEILFRGILFAGLRQRMAFLPAALLSAAAFVVPHGPSVAIPIFFLGVVLALVYERTRTVYASYAAHALLNLIPIAFTFLTIS